MCVGGGWCGVGVCGDRGWCGVCVCVWGGGVCVCVWGDRGWCGGVCVCVCVCAGRVECVCGQYKNIRKVRTYMGIEICQILMQKGRASAVNVE